MEVETKIWLQEADEIAFRLGFFTQQMRSLVQWEDVGGSRVPAFEQGDGFQSIDDRRRRIMSVEDIEAGLLPGIRVDAGEVKDDDSDTEGRAGLASFDPRTFASTPRRRLSSSSSSSSSSSGGSSSSSSSSGGPLAPPPP